MPEQLNFDPATCRDAELIDLGSGVGGSLQSAMRRFGAEGIGLELNRGKVRKAQEAGLPVYEQNILELEPADFPSVKYVMIDNVLEHLDHLDAVEEVLGQACRLASRMVHVRHPSFQDVEYLAALGLKQYWTDWPGVHTAPIKLHEFVAMAERIGVYRLHIHPVLRAHDSSDPTILPIGAPSNQRRFDSATRGAYDEAAHGPKPSVIFDRPVYFAFDLLFVTGADVPVITYHHDTEVDPNRPFFSWPEEAGTPRRGRFARVATSVVR